MKIKTKRYQSVEEIDAEIIDLENRLKIGEINPYSLIDKDYTPEEISDLELLRRPGTDEFTEITEEKINLHNRIAELKKKRLKLRANFSSKLSSPRLKIFFSKNLYDKDTSILKLSDKEIKLPRDRNEDYFCRVIFDNNKNMRKEWSWDELKIASKDRIVSKSKNPDFEPWRPVYNAAGKLNNRIRLATGISDFFLVKPITTVKINPKYLS